MGRRHIVQGGFGVTGRRILIALVVSLIFLAGAAHATNANLSLWTQNISERTVLEQIGEYDFNAEMAVSGTTVHCMWLTRNADWSGYKIFYRRSTNGGKTWQAKQLLFADDGIVTDSSYKRMAVDGQTVHIAVAHYGQGGTWFGKLTYLRSVDGGQTFLKPRVLFKAPEAWHVYDTFVTCDQGKLTIGLRSQCNWMVENSYYLLNSLDGGQTFTRRRAYRATKGSGWRVWDVQRHKDALYVLYTDSHFYYGLVYSNLYVASSRDGGATFTRRLISVPSKNGSHKTGGLQDYHYVPKIAASGDNVFVVWNGLDDTDTPGIFVRVSRDGGLTFSKAMNLTRKALPAGEVPHPGHETVAAKGSYLYVGLLTEKARVYLRRSTDAGGHFFPLQELSAPSGTRHIDGGWWPIVQTDPADDSGATVHVLWNYPTYLISRNGGKTFTRPILLSPQLSWGGSQGCQRPQMAVGTNGTLYWAAEGLFYANGVFGDYDIFCRAYPPVAEPGSANKSLHLQGDVVAARYDNMQVAASADIDFKTAMTIESWILPGRQEGYESYFLWKADPRRGGAEGAFLLGQWRDGRLDARISTTDGDYVLTGGPPLANGKWAHVAATYNANAGADNFRIYVNGEMVGSMTVTGALNTGQGILFLGGPGVYSFYSDIRIDELRLWNVARTPKQIQAGMLQSLEGNETGLCAYYPFNGSTRDMTGRGHDGVLMYRENFLEGKALQH